MYTPVQKHRIIARDRRTAAVHEAGHAVIAMHLGAQVQSVHIRKNRTADLWSEKSYVGQATYSEPPDFEQRRLIAVAGMVAEEVWRARGVTEHYWGDVMLDPECMSPTDWAETGCTPGDPDFELHEAAEAVEVLLGGALFPKLTVLSRRLIEAESRNTEEAVMRVFASIGYTVAAA
jgi:hypothetical protein